MKFNFEKIGDKIEKNIRKATLIGATVLSTLPAFTQEKTTEDQKTISVGSAQNLSQAIFEEDSMILKKPSKYSGISEQYLKDADRNIYIFNAFVDDQGNQIETPDEIKNNISQLEKENKDYENPETWAKKRLEYEKTAEYEKEVLDRKRKQHQNIIENAQAQLSYPNISSEEIDQYKNDIAKSQKTLDYMKANPKAFMEGELHTYDELLNMAGFQYKRLRDQINQQNENLHNVLKYISNH